MLGACVLLVLGSERLLFAALAPGVLGSAVFLLLGRPPRWSTRSGPRWPSPRCWPWGWRWCAPAVPARQRAGCSCRRSCGARCRPPGSGWSLPGCWPSRSRRARAATDGVNTGALLAALPLVAQHGRGGVEPAVVPAAHAAAAALQPEPERVRRPGPAGAVRRAAAVPGWRGGADRHRGRRRRGGRPGALEPGRPARTGGVSGAGRLDVHRAAVAGLRRRAFPLARLPPPRWPSRSRSALSACSHSSWPAPGCSPSLGDYAAAVLGRAVRHA